MAGMATKKRASAKKEASSSKKFSSGVAARKTAPATKRSKPKPQKDPSGGLTAEGRKAFAQKEGSHLRPGVKGPADTPEKMLRKGSFLRRHFAHPRGPMQRDGESTRLALSAHAWGEPVPKSEAEAKKLAAKGKQLLDNYHRAKEQEPGPKAKPSRKRST